MKNTIDTEASGKNDPRSQYIHSRGKN